MHKSSRAVDKNERKAYVASLRQESPAHNSINFNSIQSHR